MGNFLIQGRHGRKGNFEVVVPPSHGDGLVHGWRNNDDPAFPWSGPSCFGGGELIAAALVQGNFGTPGNLEVVAVDQAGNLDFFWRLDHAPWTWSGPFHIASGLGGAPALIQGRHGRKGNFEVVAPHRDGGLAHLWRNNDDPAMPWSAPGRFGGESHYAGTALVQGNFGTPGNLEVVAVDQAGNLDFFWRLDHAPWTWSRPFRIGTEQGFDVRECSYGWRAAYHQSDTHVSIRIQLVPDTGITTATMDALRTTWRDGIIGKWTDRFDCAAPDGEHRSITFDVAWVNSGAHHVVRVQPGPARSNMTTWDTGDDGDVASHEFGHMLGHPDEYADSACPTRSPVGTGTVMDDNSETVLRHYNRIAAFHCGHRPAARTFLRPLRHTRVHMRFIEQLDARTRADVLGRLRRIADGEPAPNDDGDHAEIAFTVSGGAPGERYDYRVAVQADGSADRHLRDDLADEPGDADESAVTGNVSPDVVAQVFAAARDVGLLDDQAPAMSTTPLPPDSLVATLTVREGDIVRRIVAPAADPDTPPRSFPGEPADLPMTSAMQLSARTLNALTPVLDALSAVEAEL